MIAFFDSLIQKEIEGWDSESNISGNAESDSDDEMVNYYDLIVQIYTRKLSGLGENYIADI